MANTLSHGYIQPANPDTGDTFWANLATDIQLMNNHVHDGSLGTILPTVTQTISSGSWSAVSGQPGTYSQTITVPTQFSYDSVEINFRLSNGTKIYPTVTRVSSSQYIVYTNDNSQNFVAVYSS
jgi:hypothetical protein